MNRATQVGEPDVSAAVPYRLPSRLAQQIVERARKAGWPVGLHLREQELADTFRVSRTPVRVALRALHDAGLLESLPNRGYFLKAQPPADIPGTGAPAEDPLYFRIADDRLTGLLDPRFTESVLARRYGVPRTRISRLLLQMVHEGLVVRMPGHGWEFQPLLSSTEAYDQAYRYRILIEPAALLEPGYALPAGTLRQARARQKAMLDVGIHSWSRSDTFAANSEFHEIIVSGAANPFLLEGLQRVNRRRRLLEYRTHQFRERLVGECTDHLHLLDMIERGALPAAAEFLQAHLERARAAKSDLLQRSGGAGAGGIGGRTLNR